MQLESARKLASFFDDEDPAATFSFNNSDKHSIKDLLIPPALKSLLVFEDPELDGQEGYYGLHNNYIVKYEV